MGRVVVGLLLASFLFVSRAEASPSVTSVARTRIGPLERTELTVRAGPNAIDRFFVYHLERNGPSRGSVLLLPTLTSGFSTYEIGENGDYLRSFAARLALVGYDVWGTSQRVEGLAAGSCESGAVDCSSMASWGVASVVEDGRFALALIRETDPNAKPVVGGFSLGSIAAIATVNAYPDDYAGLMAIEGTLYDDAPAVQSINAAFCAGEEQALAAGVLYDGTNLPAIKGIAQLSSSAPNAPSPIPTFAGLTNHQALVATFATPAVTPSTPRPTYFLLAGDVAQDRFTYADEDRFVDVLMTFPDYVTMRTMRDVNCSLAGERTFTGNLDAFRGEVLVIADRFGFGTGMVATASLMSHAHVDVEFHDHFGHADAVFAKLDEVTIDVPVRSLLARAFSRR